MSDEQVVPPVVAQVPAIPVPPTEIKEAVVEEPKLEVETPETEEKRKSRAARRFDRIRERAIAAETELRLLKERAIPAQAAKPEPESDEPTRDKYGTYEEFIEARADYRAQKTAAKIAEDTLRKAVEEDQKARAHETQEKSAKEWSKRIDTARDDIDDFDEVCAESEAVVTPAMSYAMMESDKGAHIAYFLAKNPAEAERISKLSNSKQAAAIVALEEKVAKPVKTPSNAPAPIKPVGVKSDASSLDTTDPKTAEKLSTSEWIARDRERMQKAGKR